MGQGESTTRLVADAPVVVVVGAGYGGHAFAKALDKTGHWNVVLIDRKDHHLHNMAACRAVVQPNFEEEILIPYSNLLKNGSVIQGEVIQITESYVEIHGHPEPVRFDFLVIATGSSYAFPGKLAEATRAQALAKYKECQAVTKAAKKITIVGGGPVGVELAGEIAQLYPDKSITMISSRTQLCEEPGLVPEFTSQIKRKLEALKVRLVLGERTLLEESKKDALTRAKLAAIQKEDFALAQTIKQQLEELDNLEAMQAINLKDNLPVNYVTGERVLVTDKGTEVETDLVFFCMGIAYNTASLSAFADRLEKPGRLMVDGNLKVLGCRNIFAIGDISNKDAPMGYNAGLQAKYLANYFEKQIRLSKPVKAYPPAAPAAIVSIGSKDGVCQLPTGSKPLVLGSTTTTFIKSKDMFVKENWKTMNLDRKTKQPVESANEEQTISLAAAMQINEEQAKEIQKGQLPELQERDGFFS